MPFDAACVCAFDAASGPCLQRDASKNWVVYASLKFVWYV